MKRLIRLSVVASVVAVLAITLGAQERDRSKVADKYKWNLADIYPSDAAWRAAKDAFTAEIPSAGKFKGRLMSSPATLADALDTMYAKRKELSRLSVYTSLLEDQDARDSAHQGMRQEMMQVATAFGAEVAYVNPEI